MVENAGCGPRVETGSLTLLILERETQAAALCDRNSPSGEADHETKPAYVFSYRCGGFQPWRPCAAGNENLRHFEKLQRAWSDQPESLILAQNERWRKA